MEKIVVLLSTYNGEKYLEEQLDSLASQNGVVIELLVRDDGSTDGTAAILDRWQDEGRLSWYTSANLGPGKSFMHLLQTAGGGGYYAFCDQDDVWLPDKVKRVMEAFDEGYDLVLHNAYITDGKLNITDYSFFEKRGSKNFVKERKEYIEDKEKIKILREKISL